MIRRLDVDTAKLVKIDKGGAYAEARKKCLNCLSARECLAWVHASPPSGEAPSFCANFRAIRTVHETAFIGLSNLKVGRAPIEKSATTRGGADKAVGDLVGRSMKAIPRQNQNRGLHATCPARADLGSG